MTTQPTTQRLLRRSWLAVGAALCCLALLAVACTSSSSGGKGTFKFRALDAGGPLTTKALQDGSIDIGEFFSVNSTPADKGWVTLADDKHLQSADNFVPAVRTAKATPAVTKVLNSVDAALTQNDMQQMVKKVSSGDKASDVADDWLKSHKSVASSSASGSIKIGYANFTESGVAAYLYGQALKQAGVSVSYANPVAARQIYWPSLLKGDYDLVPEFTYSLLSYLNPNAKPSSDLATIYKEVKAEAAKKQVTITQPSKVTDVNVFVVTKDTADKYHLKTLSDLAKVKDSLTLGGPPECLKKNPLCVPGLEKVYGMKFSS